jgi:hypothetical protein
MKFSSLSRVAACACAVCVVRHVSRVCALCVVCVRHVLRVCVQCVVLCVRHVSRVCVCNVCCVCDMSSGDEMGWIFQKSSIQKRLEIL